MSVRDCRLAELWERGQLCDIEVVAGGETFKAHRIVLAACSEFMQSLLTGGWRDSTGPLTLPDVDPSAFSTVLTWMYRGYVSVDRAALPAIFHAATLLQIATLQAAAEENVIALLRRGQMDPIEWWHTADALHLQTLRDAAMVAALAKFDHVVTSPEFHEASPAFVKDLLSDDRLHYAADGKLTAQLNSTQLNSLTAAGDRLIEPQMTKDLTPADLAK